MGRQLERKEIEEGISRRTRALREAERKKERDTRGNKKKEQERRERDTEKERDTRG